MTQTHAGDPEDERPPVDQAEVESGRGHRVDTDTSLSDPLGTEPEEESPTEELRRAADLAELVGLSRARYDRGDLLRRSGLEDVDTRRWWRAMGIVEVPDGVVAFGAEDLAMVRALKVAMAQDDHSEEHIFRLARLLGGSFSRIAEAQTAVLDDMLAQDPDINPLDSPANRAAALQSPDSETLLDIFEQSMMYVWRRHLFAALGRWIGADEEEVNCAVGFADISGFSQMSKRTPGAELAEVVERFESEAVDVVSSHGGRVVKFIGDEAFFVVEDVSAAVDVALELNDRMAEGDLPVRLHTGLAVGPTVTIAGDVFGTTVNLAKRLTDAARKGKVVLPKDSAAELEERDDLAVRRVSRVFELKGIGRTAVVSVSRRRTDED